MIINNNMMAKNSHRMLGINASTMGKSTEKLSSGLRVNRAADDAAGLSISEKMRGQIRGLTQASRNAQDGISVVQTAEGALDEVHSILQRMRQLAVQSANDSNVKEDREALQKEVTALTAEIDRISGTTEFNTQKLLDGSFTGKVFHVGANEGQVINVKIDSMSAEKLGVGKQDTTGLTAAQVALGHSKGNYETSVTQYTSSVTAIQATIDTIQTSIQLLKTELDTAVATGAATDTIQNNLKDAATRLAGRVAARDARQKDVDNSQAKVDAHQRKIDSLTDELTAAGNNTIYIKSQDAAERAITKINAALTKVSTQRSELGAIQNRMEHTIRNLDNAAENTQAAESRIRDVDMALEMSQFTKKNILTQASQAMLAQANQLPQQVLQLLR